MGSKMGWRGFNQRAPARVEGEAPSGFARGGGDASPCNSGFTLIGILVAVGIFSFVASGVYTLILSLEKGYAQQAARAEVQQQARAALSIFSNEVQGTGYDPKGDAFNLAKETKTRRAPLFDADKSCDEKIRNAAPVMEASETVFHFMGDVGSKDGKGRGNGTFNKNEDESEDIRYEWVGKNGKSICSKEADMKTAYTLRRDTGGQLQEVASGITHFALTYFDENGKPLVGTPLNADDRGKIRKIRLTAQTSANGDKGQKQQWISEIILKNMG